MNEQSTTQPSTAPLSGGPSTPSIAEDASKGVLANVWLPLVVAVIGLVGVASGGALQYFATHDVARTQREAERKAAIYGEFMAAQAAVQSAKPAEQGEHGSVENKVQASVMKVFAFGDATTIAAIASARRAKAGKPCSMSATDVAVYQAIRHEIFGAGGARIADADVAMALFGCVVTSGPG